MVIQGNKVVKVDKTDSNFQNNTNGLFKFKGKNRYHSANGIGSDKQGKCRQEVK